MSRSLFSASPFRPVYGNRTVRLHGLGQDDIKDIFGDVGEDVTKLVGDLDQYIEKLPVGVAGPYAQRRDDCMRKSTLEQYKCLYDLFQDIKKALKDEEERPTVTPGPTIKPSASGGLPIVPIVIGGIATAAVLYAVFKG
jgi:hypothetical protein